MKTFTTSLAVKHAVRDNVFYVAYFKEDGSLRRAKAQLGVTVCPTTGKVLVKGTLDDTQKEFEKSIGIVRYYDHGAHGYRQFSLANLKIMRVNGKTIFRA